ncbi:MAG: DoxX family membrane protein [Myxococcota bacterium]
MVARTETVGRQGVVAWLDAHRWLFVELVRIYLGLGLFAMGANFVVHTAYIVSRLEGGLWSQSAVGIAHLVATAHLAGGLLLALGLITRVAALMQIPVVLGAIFFVHLREGLFTEARTLEFATLVLFLLCLFAVFGSGPLSLDHYLSREVRPRERDAWRRTLPVPYQPPREPTPRT